MSNMEGSLRGIKSTLEYVQSTTTYILERVNNLTESNEPVCTCACHSPGSSQIVIQEIHDLKERMKKLEEIVRQYTNIAAGGYTPERDVSYQTNEGGLSHIQRTSPRNLPGDDKSVLKDRKMSQKPSASVHPLEDVTKTQNVQKQTPVTQKQSNVNVENVTLPSSLTAGSRGDDETWHGARETREILQPLDSLEQTKKISDKETPNTLAISKLRIETSTNRSSAQGMNVEVVKQSETRLLPNSGWVTLAQMELDSARATELTNLEGANTAILLDISESMSQGDAWIQAKTFIDNFVDGLSNVSREPGLTDEHVSFVTFGHDTRVVHRLTNQYEQIRNAFGSVRLGGPSPLYGGLFMALVSIIPSKEYHSKVNDIQVNSKVIVISDGHITKTEQQAGPDVTDDSQEEYIKHLVAPVSQLLERGIDIYMVPVGNCNEKLVEFMGKQNGRLWSWQDGVKLSRRTYLTVVAGPGIRLGLFGPEFDPNFSSDLALSDSDRLQMLDIVSEARIRHFNEMTRRIRGENDPYLDTENDRLLAVGTRVTRGPDWNPKQEEDDNGPGTVVGHFRYADKVWVQWDVGEKVFNYRYGDTNAYEVLAVDKDRKPSEDGRLVVGCTVKPSKSTTITHPELKPFDRGVVIVVDSQNLQLSVKWKSGMSGVYDYIHGVKEAVEFSPTSELNVPTTNTEDTKQPRARKNKNS